MRKKGVREGERKARENKVWKRERRREGGRERERESMTPRVGLVTGGELFQQ